MLKVVSFKICPFVQRVTAALAARAVPFEVEYISLSNPPGWFDEVSPNAQVPLLVTESGVVLFESDAIVEYIEDAYGPLQEDISSEQRAIERAWSYQASKHYLVQCSAMRSPDADSLAERSQQLGKAFKRVESALSQGPFFNGESLGKVDVAWLPLLHRAAIIEQRTGYDFLESFSKVKVWQAALMDTQIVKQSVAEDFESVFSEFYLSQETYLGNGEGCESASGDLCGSSACCG